MGAAKGSPALPTVILVSPTEPAGIRKMGKTSSIPEKYGVDLFFYSRQRKIGVQRKEMNDFVASVYDGRLGRELLQMKALDQAALFIEGRPTWTNTGELIHRGSDFNRNQLYGLVFSIESENGVLVLFTNSQEDTAAALQVFMRWCEKDEHGSLAQRSKPFAPWGAPTSRDWGIYLLQSFPGIGRKVAAAIYDHYGRVPIRWDITKDDLLKVPGVGEKRATDLLKSL